MTKGLAFKNENLVIEVWTDVDANALYINDVKFNADEAGWLLTAIYSCAEALWGPKNNAERDLADILSRRSDVPDIDAHWR